MIYKKFSSSHPAQLLLAILMFTPPSSFANVQTQLLASSEEKPSNNLQELKWLKKINFDYSTLALNNQPRKGVVELYIETDGSISNVKIIKSTGIAKLDQQIVQTIKTTAQFQPIASPTQVKLPLTLKPYPPKKPATSSWLVQPYIQYLNQDLNGKNRMIKLNILRDSKGYIEQISIDKSTGLKHLDEKVIAGFKNARLDPHKTPHTSNLVMSLNRHNADYESNQVILDKNITSRDAEKIWQYFPNLSYSNAELEGQNRMLTIRLEFAENGHVRHSTIITTSGIPTLDASILVQMKQAILYKSHAPVTLDIPLELKAKK